MVVESGPAFHGQSFHLFTRGEVAAAGGIGLILGKINQPTWKTAPGILFRHGKKRFYHLRVVFRDAFGKWVSRIQVTKKYAGTIHLAVKPPSIRYYTNCRSPGDSYVITYTFSS